MLPVFGRSGDIPLDENAYENTNLSLNMYMKAESEEEMYSNRTKLMSLFDTGDYVDFVPYFDYDKVYSVMVVGSVVFTSHRKYRFNEIAELELTVKPFKYYRDNQHIIATNGGSIHNVHHNDSLPVMKLTGVGDSTISVNGRPFVIKNIQEYIIIDSQVQHSYKEVAAGLVNENSKIYTLDYPVLKKGNNKITWTGNLSKVEIQPRWWTLI